MFSLTRPPATLSHGGERGCQKRPANPEVTPRLNFPLPGQTFRID
jgi:hypothetical protein